MNDVIIQRRSHGYTCSVHVFEIWLQTDEFLKHGTEIYFDVKYFFSTQLAVNEVLLFD